MGHMTITTPLSGTVCPRWAGTRHDQAVYQILCLYEDPIIKYEKRQKYRNWGGLWAMGHSR